MPSYANYSKLPSKDEDECSSERSTSDYASNSSHPKRISWGWALLGVALIVSTNICTYLVAGQRSESDMLSPFAGLKRDLLLPWQDHNPYVSDNRTEALTAWSRINIDAGTVAFPPELSKQHDLPIAQPFVWDHSKGTYLLNGYHQLHCARAIYLSLMEFHYGVKQSRSFWHVIHCVDSLRQDILCNADDTPRYSTESDLPETAMGQERLCRSWDKLEEWAKQYNACYSFVNQTTSLVEVQRFLYCPEDSPYRQVVEKTFGDVPSYEELDLEEWVYKSSFDKLIEASKASQKAG